MCAPARRWGRYWTGGLAVVVLAAVAVGWRVLRPDGRPGEQGGLGRNGPSSGPAGAAGQGARLSLPDRLEGGGEPERLALPSLDSEEDLPLAVRLDLAWPRTRARVRSYVRVLREESLEESVRRLADVEEYMYPGVPDQMMGVDLPLPDDVGQGDVQLLMSNRRFLKVLDEAASRPGPEAGHLLNEEIGKALPEYVAALGKYLERNRQERPELFQPGSTPTVGPVFKIGNNRDGSPTLTGLRLQLLALLLVAADGQVEGAGPAVLAVAREGARQRELLYDGERVNAVAGCLMLVQASLYSRQIVATALLRTCMSPEQGAELQSRLSLEWQTRRLPRYDAEATAYDVYTRAGDVRVDYSKGARTVRFLRRVSDAQFDEILSAAEAAEREQPGTTG
jgi:hypothetical protein